ncbi:hypothetical protein CC79DRAFT_1394089 [Sarocladium strictum]
MPSSQPQPAPSIARGRQTIVLRPMVLRDDTSIQKLLSDFRPLMKPDQVIKAQLSSDVWCTELLQSEPALVEASLSVSPRHGCLSEPQYCKTKIDEHGTKALELLRSRLACPEVCLRDGILGVVLLLAFSEVGCYCKVFSTSHV